MSVLSNRHEKTHTHTHTHRYWRGKVGVHQRTLKHCLLFVKEIYIPPLKKLEFTKQTVRTQRKYKEKHYFNWKGDWFNDRDSIPVVLVSVSWAEFPPPPSGASSLQDSMLCSCSGSSCSCLWPDWLTVLLTTRDNRSNSATLTWTKTMMQLNSSSSFQKWSLSVWTIDSEARKRLTNPGCTRMVLKFCLMCLLMCLLYHNSGQIKTNWGNVKGH